MLTKTRLLHLILLILGCLPVLVSAQLPAFPGAEGFGKWVTGGRGGEVVAVTNLLDDPDNPPEGSFRWAIEKYTDRTQPLTIVFRVSGIIDLKARMNIQRSNLTIAGQTAPGDGVCFRGHYFRISGGGSAGIQRNVILRYLRFRPGLDIHSDDLAKGIGALGIENCEHIIVDHCSFSWANEECAIFYDNKFTTVQWCIASEGLYDAGHAKGERSYCGVWGGQYASYHHNLIAHNRSRTIRFNGARAHDTVALVDYRNNVVYNWNSSGGCYGGEVEIEGGASYANLVNNYYKPGPATPLPGRFVTVSHNQGNQVPGQWFVSGNVMNGDSARTADNWVGTSLAKIPAARRTQAQSAGAFPVDESLPHRSADSAYALVLNRAGASFPRDTIDARIVHETRTGTATGTGVIGDGIIDDPAAVGGYPDYLTYNVPEDEDEDGMDDAWELDHGLDPSDPEDRNLLGQTGYTMLEVYLNGLVEHLAIVADSLPYIRGIQPFYCAGEDPRLVTGYPSGGSFRASPGLTVIGGDTAIFDPHSAGDFTITYLLNPGDPDTDSALSDIVVHPIPQAAILGLDTSYIPAEETIALTGSPEGGAFLPTDGVLRPGRDESPFDLSVPGDFQVYYHFVLAPGCGDTAVAHTVIKAPQTVNAHRQNQLRIYPNPATSHVHIDSQQPLIQVRIYTHTGSLVREISGDLPISLDSLKEGIYYLWLQFPGEVHIRKLMKIN